MKRIIPLTPRRWLALEIFRRMKHERVEEHPLRQLFWECTLRCNVRCRHCGSDCKSSPATPDMPLQDFLKVLDSISTIPIRTMYSSLSPVESQPYVKIWKLAAKKYPDGDTRGAWYATACVSRANGFTT